MTTLRIIKNNLMSVLTKTNLIIISLVFSCQFVLFVSAYGVNPFYSLQEAAIIIFYGPFNPSFELLRWLFHQVPIYVMIGYFIDREIKARTIYILPRIGCINTWIFGISFSTFVYTFIYYLIGFSFTLLLINLLGGFFESDFSHNFHLLNEYNPNLLLLHLFLLLVLSTFSMILISIILSLLINNSAISFSVLMMLILIPVVGSNIFQEIIQWFPSSHGMLFKLEIFHWPLTWSHMYVTILILLLYFLLFLIVRKRLSDILSEND